VQFVGYKLVLYHWDNLPISFIKLRNTNTNKNHHCLHKSTYYHFMHTVKKPVQMWSRWAIAVTQAPTISDYLQLTLPNFINANCDVLLKYKIHSISCSSVTIKITLCSIRICNFVWILFNSNFMENLTSSRGTPIENHSSKAWETRS
jgi:hypothetical protein